MSDNVSMMDAIEGIDGAIISDLDPIDLRPVGRASLFSKMARVMGRLDRIPKNGFNSFHNYHYTTNSDVVDSIRRAMAAENLALFVTIDRIEREQYSSGRENKSKWRTSVYFEFCFADGDSGETYPVIWVGEANDEDDKGIAKAATNAEKYFLLKTFLISTDEDDPDASGSGNRPASGAERRAESGGRQGVNRPATPPAAGSGNRPAATSPAATSPAATSPAKVNGGGDQSKVDPAKPPQTSSTYPSWYPKDEKDYVTFFNVVCPKFNLSKDDGAASLKETANDAIEATRRIEKSHSPK